MVASAADKQAYACHADEHQQNHRDDMQRLFVSEPIRRWYSPV